MTTMLLIYNLCDAYYYGLLVVASYNENELVNYYRAAANFGYAFVVFLWL